MAFGVHADHNPVQEISATFAMQGGQPGRSIIAGSASQTEQQYWSGCACGVMLGAVSCTKFRCLLTIYRF